MKGWIFLLNSQAFFERLKKTSQERRRNIYPPQIFPWQVKIAWLFSDIFGKSF
jgi:hypothetical protein